MNKDEIINKVEIVERSPSIIRILFYIAFILPSPFFCVKSLRFDIENHALSFVGALGYAIVFPISVFLVIKLFKFSFRLVEYPVHFR